jgi:phosphatidylglycerophosphate synthase
VGRCVPDEVAGVLSESIGLAFKAYEIEELADVYFFRPLGMIFAQLARALRLTPTAVTIVGSAVGIAGGVLLFTPRLGLVGFALIIFHSILDSSDGQLARMTGQTTEFGRLLDGIGGGLTYVAIICSIAAGMIARGAQAFPWSAHDTAPLVIAMLAFLSGVATVLHALMYDYHRTSYVRAVVKGIVEQPADAQPGFMTFYEAMERKISGRHRDVEAYIAGHADRGVVHSEDRSRYRAAFYWLVRGWNLMGDNTRFYAVGVLVLAGHLEWYFAFTLLAMNAAFVALWLWQQRADSRFLAELVIN